MIKTRIIGIGSPFGSDQFGWQVIDHLEQKMLLSHEPPTEIELLSVDRPGVNLLSCFDDIDFAIVLDAIAFSSQTDMAMNSIIRLGIQDLLGQETALSSHSTGVAETLCLGDKLDLLPDKLVLIGCYTMPDMPVTRRVLEQAADVVIQELNFQSEGMQQACTPG